MASFGKRGQSATRLAPRLSAPLPPDRPDFDRQASLQLGAERADMNEPSRRSALVVLAFAMVAGVIGLGVFAYAAGASGLLEPGDREAGEILATMNGDHPATMKGRTYQLLVRQFSLCEKTAREAAGIGQDEERPGQILTANDWLKAGDRKRTIPPSHLRWNVRDDHYFECLTTSIEPAMCDPYARWFLGVELSIYVSGLAKNEYGRFPEGTTVNAALAERAMPSKLKQAIRHYYGQKLLDANDLNIRHAMPFTPELFLRITSGQPVAPASCS